MDDVTGDGEVASSAGTPPETPRDAELLDALAEYHGGGRSGPLAKIITHTTELGPPLRRIASQLRSAASPAPETHSPVSDEEVERATRILEEPASDETSWETVKRILADYESRRTAAGGPPDEGSGTDFRTLVRDAIAELDASGFPGGFSTDDNPTFEAVVSRICSAANARLINNRLRAAGGPSDAEQAERCVKCGESFEVTETREYFASPTTWVTRQRFGPLHPRCLTFPPKMQAVIDGIWEGSAAAGGASDASPDKYEEAARAYDRKGLQDFTEWMSKRFPMEAGRNCFEVAKEIISQHDATGNVAPDEECRDANCRTCREERRRANEETEAERIADDIEGDTRAAAASREDKADERGGSGRAGMRTQASTQRIEGAPQEAAVRVLPPEGEIEAQSAGRATSGIPYREHIATQQRDAFARGAVATGTWTRDEADEAAKLAYPDTRAAIDKGMQRSKLGERVAPDGGSDA